MSMKCPHAPEIKRQLLMPRCKGLLQRYIDHWKIDRGFLVYHRESTALSLRQELDCFCPTRDCQCGCGHLRLAECCMVDILKEVMEEHIVEQELEVV